MSSTESDAGGLSLAGIALPDASALVGGVVWLSLLLVGDLDVVEQALTLAPLVLVPLGVGMAATPPFTGAARRLYDTSVVIQPVGAILFAASVVVPFDGGVAAVLAAPWIVVTGLLALAAVARASERGLRPLPETVVDTGLAYAVVGAVALVLYHLDVTFWFSPVIVLLTAVHFHYAGFVLPVVTGLVGRSATRQSRVYEAVATVVLVGPALIAVGISFSPLVEVLAVTVFTTAVAVLGGYVLVRTAPTRPRLQGTLVGLSALALPVSMCLALGYAVAVYFGFDPFGLSISRMVRIHGALNAFGFALVGLLGWRLAVPPRVERR
ncbi:YndJ-like protein [Halogranum gelatinilyticum]|uniref:YndJ-like protein n=1 Tax=Halogranum gelatinilyticum TaxID=660521 RepID=A0A1G9YTH1_9EURY|nr:YndJ family protein [Halogranum gelatinilyticum]SDN11703.1 YndJ-like protein [Halogranum gelatinilyticum]